MAGNQLYTLFCSSDAALLQNIVNRMPDSDKGNLRLASPALRRATTDTISTVTCRLHGPRFDTDAGDVFPAARRVVLGLGWPFYSRKATAVDACNFLHHHAATSPLLLSRATELTIDLKGVECPPDLQMSILHVLTRCTSLDKLCITWCCGTNRYTSPSRITFTGHGATPAARRASMQRQLAAITASPAFLAPASWPTHSCLTALTLPVEENSEAYRTHLQSAISTTSLVHLSTSCASVDDLPSCDALSALCNLTALSLSSKHAFPEHTLPQLAAAISHLPSLAWLTVDGNVLARGDTPGMPNATLLPTSWSRLTSLTSLTLEDCRLSLSQLPLLPALQEFDMHACTTAGSLSQLSALTALTSIADEEGEASNDGAGEGAAGADEQQGGAQLALSVLGGTLPQQWQQGLQDLAWSYRPADMPLLASLQALTRLKLNQAVLCPRLCRELACLPRLNSLWLVQPTVRDGFTQARHSSLAFRPQLPSLSSFSIDEDDEDDDDPHPHLELFACLTDVRSDLEVDLTGVEMNRLACSQYEDYWHLEYTSWGAGWLPALLRAVQGAGAEHGRSALALVVTNDGSAASLVQALRDPRNRALATLGGSGRSSLLLLLGKDVAVHGFRQLFAAARHLPGGCLHIAAREQQQTEWISRVPSYFFSCLAGISAPGLRRLQLDDCSKMRDTSMSAVVAATPDLEVLELRKAVQLSDCALYALVGCRKLSRVRLEGCSRVTAEGVAMLLTSTAQPLAELVADNVEPGAVVASLRRVTWARRGEAADMWAVGTQRHGDSGLLHCLLKKPDTQ